MNALRVLIESETALHLVYWLRRRPAFIHAWCFAANAILPSIRQPLRGEMHWTYPEDGTLHGSIRIYGGPRLVETHHFFKEEIRSKTPGGSVKRPFNISPLSSLSILLPGGYQAPPLSAYSTGPEFFTFPSASISTYGPGLAGLREIPRQSARRPGDLVIPSTVGHATFLAHIEGLGRHQPYDGPAGKPQLLTDRSAFPHISVGAFVG